MNQFLQQNAQARMSLRGPEPVERDKKDYHYDRKGPWPQPSPNHPLGESPAIVHLPKEERSRWFWSIHMRYLRDAAFYWPAALWYAWRRPHMEEVDDATFHQFVCHECYSKFLRRGLDAEKRAMFDTLIREDAPDTSYYVLDLTLAQYIQPFEGMYAAPVVALFRARPDGSDKQVAGIFMLESELLLTPQDGDAWELAKYFTLQGATYKLVLSEHSLLHFPFDTINAIAKTALPKDSLLLRLLWPHLDYTLVLNNSVLESERSPVVNDPSLPYTALVGHGDGFRDLLQAAYKGIEDNPYYPPYRFTLRPQRIDSDFGVFLDTYYETILDFVRQVVAHIPKQEWGHIRLWAHYIAQWLPGFPDEEQIEDPEVLSQVVAMFIWDVSVGHAADHHNYATLPVNQLPLRMRMAPPTSKQVQGYDRRKLVNWVDIFKYRMERRLFFMPTNVSLLFDTDYAFEVPALQQLNAQFLQELQRTEVRLRAQGIKLYIPLREISRSIQY